MKGYGWHLVALAALLLAPLVALNAAVAYFGDSHVPLFSPYYFGEKVRALGQYGQHRIVCLFSGDGALEPNIHLAERRHRLPRGLLAAVIHNESSMRPHRISKTGAMGPAQLMPGTAEMLGVDDPFDAAEAVDGSARYLAQNLRRFRSVPLAVAAYHAGPGAVRGGVPRGGETEIYVQRVMREMRRRQPKRPFARMVQAARASENRGVEPQVRERADASANPERVDATPTGRSESVKGGSKASVKAERSAPAKAGRSVSASPGAAGSASSSRNGTGTTAPSRTAESPSAPTKAAPASGSTATQKRSVKKQSTSTRVESKRESPAKGK